MKATIAVIAEALIAGGFGSAILMIVSDVARDAEGGTSPSPTGVVIAGVVIAVIAWPIWRYTQQASKTPVELAVEEFAKQVESLYHASTPATCDRLHDSVVGLMSAASGTPWTPRCRLQCK